MEGVRHKEVDEVGGEKERLQKILAKRAEEQRRKKAIEEAALRINENVQTGEGKKK